MKAQRITMKTSTSVRRATARFVLSASLAALLAACATQSPTPSRIPNQTADITWKDGLFSQPLSLEHTRPGCRGECPTLKVQSLIFPGVPELTSLIDRTLADMTPVAGETQPSYQTLQQFETYYWNTAGPRDETLVSAEIRYANKALTVLELGSWQYYTGAAHGNSTTQFLNWDNAAKRRLSLDDFLMPGALPAYQKALQQAHQQWMTQHPDAQHDMAGFQRMWPFQPSKNAAITDAGLLVKYNAYEIAPYSSGQPELLIPYPALKGILRASYLPPGI